MQLYNQNMKKGSKEPKRSASPIINTKTIQFSQKKKKPSINSNLGIDNLKQTQGLYGKTQRKKSNLSKQSINKYQNTKYRIVTEPIQHYKQPHPLLNGNIFNNESFTRMPIDRKKTQIAQSSEKKIKFHFKNSTTIPNLKSVQKEKSPSNQCKSCQQYKQIHYKMMHQLQEAKDQIQNVLVIADTWKNGKCTLLDVKNYFFSKKTETYKHKILQEGIEKKNYKNFSEINFSNRYVTNLKVRFLDLMTDIESLSHIDFKKMVQTEIFTYQAYETNDTQSKIQEAKSLLNELKEQYYGLNIQEPLEFKSDHNELMLRNLKSRLNQSLRQNLELKIKRQLFLRASQIKGEQQEYIRKTIKEVLEEK